MKPHSIPTQELILFLKPDEPGGAPSYEIELSRFFCDILQRADDFVPSEAGTIYLRDATTEDAGGPQELVVAASFGDQTRKLLGERLAIEEGIAGFVLQEGQAYVSAVPSTDLLLGAEGTGEAAGTVVALPLSARGEVVGVLELLKERGGEPFDERELELLEIFAQTISASIGHAIEAQHSKEMARRDDLTHLFNDRYLHHTLTAVLAEAIDGDRDCGLLFLDLDHFKHVNDTHGHLVGSRVLREVGDLLRQVLPGPSIPARYGGDEFVVILPEATRQEVFWVAETIRKTVETHLFLERPDPNDPVNYPGLAISGITCSVGLATLREDTLPLFAGRKVDPLSAKNELIRIADGRMYRGKDSGRNVTVAADGDGEAEDGATAPGIDLPADGEEIGTHRAL